MTDSKRRILILMSDTGGGHRSAAEAIKSAFEREFPGRYNITLVDAIKQSAVFPFNHIPDWYLPFVTYAELLWDWGFWLTNQRAIAPIVLGLVRLLMGRGVQKLLRDHPADLVLSVHPVFTAFPRKLLRRAGSHAPFAVVVTDLFTIHRLWTDPGADLTILPTEGSREVAWSYGMPDERMRVIGQPMSLKFLGTGKNKIEYRAELGLDLHRPTILLVGGGEGMGKLYDIARAIDAARLPIQIVIIAGRNQALRQKLDAAQWQTPAIIQGFVTNMPDWMRASDLVITKAGPGTIMEALACGLPVLLSGFLPGQETGNVTFVEQSKVGILCREPEKIARTIGEWLVPGNDTLACFAQNARQFGRADATLGIARTLDELLTTQLAQESNAPSKRTRSIKSYLTPRQLAAYQKDQFRKLKTAIATRGTNRRKRFSSSLQRASRWLRKRWR